MEKRWSHFILPFSIFFVFSLLIINWSEISWIFDWHVIKRVSEEIIVSSKDKELGREAIGEINRLVISSLDIEAPLRTPSDGSDIVLLEELDLGVVHYPYSAEPGAIGKTVILGHSAPIGYPDIKFDRVFSELGELKPGDEIKIYYNERLFSYIVDNVQTMSIDEYNHFLLESTEEHILILSTCYPPGRNWQRWVISSHLLTE